MKHANKINKNNKKINHNINIYKNQVRDTFKYLSNTIDNVNIKFIVNV